MAALPQTWNSHDWGTSGGAQGQQCNAGTKARVAAAKVIHWSGAAKPWKQASNSSQCRPGVCRSGDASTMCCTATFNTLIRALALFSYNLLIPTPSSPLLLVGWGGVASFICASRCFALATVSVRVLVEEPCCGGQAWRVRHAAQPGAAAGSARVERQSELCRGGRQFSGVGGQPHGMSRW